MEKVKRVHCKHFNGVIHDQCRAGITYRPGYIDQCIGNGEATGAICQRCEYPTPEEVENEGKKFRCGLENVSTARHAIVQHTQDKPGDGEIPCPVCKTGTLYFSVHSNKHVHARCSTAGCVAWME